jgi:hypothetical protein
MGYKPTKALENPLLPWLNVSELVVAAAVFCEEA